MFSFRTGAMRRAIVCLLLAIAAWALTSCSGLPRGSYDALRLAVSGRALDITPEQVAANPYAQLLVDGPEGQSLMVLGNDDEGLTSWFTPDRRIVFLRDGVLAGTHGQSTDAIEIRVLGDDNPFTRLASIESARTHRRYDWMPGYRYGVELHGRLQRGQLETVEVLDQSRELQRFDEYLEGSGLKAHNRYWADPRTGAIVRSREFVGPGVELQITVLKPYAPGAAR